MSDISSEKEGLLRDAAFLERTAKEVFSDRTYRLGDTSGLDHIETNHVGAQKLHDGRTLASRSIGQSLQKTEIITDALFRIMIPNYADYGLQEQDQERQKDLGDKLEETDGHLRNNIIPHLTAALELISEVGQDFEEFVGFMKRTEEGFWTKANELRIQAKDL